MLQTAPGDLHPSTVAAWYCCNRACFSQGASPQGQMVGCKNKAERNYCLHCSPGETNLCTAEQMEEAEVNKQEGWLQPTQHPAASPELGALAMEEMRALTFPRAKINPVKKTTAFAEICSSASESSSSLD